jgi:triosephosphate isomerase
VGRQGPILRSSPAALAAEIGGTALPVLYGGSVSAQNCGELAGRPHIDDSFVGRAT